VKQYFSFYPKQPPLQPKRSGLRARRLRWLWVFWRVRKGFGSSHAAPVVKSLVISDSRFICAFALHMYKQVAKELSEIKKPEEDRLKKAFERLDVDRDGALRFGCPQNL